MPPSIPKEAVLYPMPYSSPILQVRNLKTHFFTFEGIFKSVDDVSFDLQPAETIGIVGESGCGKSVTALSIMRLIKTPPGRIVGGQILFKGSDLLAYSAAAMRAVRGDRISMIFQEPMTSLNPLCTIGDQIAEVYTTHQHLGQREGSARAVEILKRVQIPAPQKRAREYPHQLSGGMRQRAMIAMALACNPEILIADEPTTALDVTIQAQIIDLLLKLREDFKTAIIMISHNLGLIAEIAQRIVVMYAGRVVEQGSPLEIFENPLHPYTRGLLQSIPKLGRRSLAGRERLLEIAGIVPGLNDLPPGCAFHPRCTAVMPVCRQRPPELIPTRGGHGVRCWLYAGDKTAGAGESEQ
jgi:oligopeptide/dipeptide ABC transporter ATP-binding protein